VRPMGVVKKDGSIDYQSLEAVLEARKKAVRILLIREIMKGDQAFLIQPVNLEEPR